MGEVVRFHESVDDEIFECIRQEEHRQEYHIELIASENYASPMVMSAVGSVLSNKYAEGYPGRRYYGGCEHVDDVELIAISRAKQLFNAEYANVQPHSGSQANAAAYLALLEAGDNILGMSLTDGGHLTHGSAVNFSGKIYNSCHYGVSGDSGLIDYDEVRDLARKHRPKLILTGFSAYSRKLDWEIFRQIADENNSFLLADIAHVAGLVATGLYPSPIEFADVVTSTTHKTLRGPRSGIILSNAEERFGKKLNSAVFPGTQGGPLMHVVAAKAIAFKEAMEDSFLIYQQQVLKNAKKMADVFLERGFDVVSGGTDNHLFLVDLTNKEITGKEGEHFLGQVGITVNKNTVPNDVQSPFVTSGIRVGTPAITTRGFKEEQAKIVANLMCDILDNKGSAKVVTKVALEVKNLCRDFCVYPNEKSEVR